jgi:hypothetical protein
MTRLKNDRRKTAAKHGTAASPSGVNVVPAPENAARRKLLSGPEIETSGGSRTVHHDPVGR